MSKPLTALAERRHMDAVASLGCICCRREGLGCSPAEIHHAYHDRMRRDHLRVIPMCPTHHRLGGPGVALHAGKRQWEQVHGTEAELLEDVAALLEFSREIA